MLDPATLERQRRLDTALLESSASAGWTSALVERRRWSHRWRDFDPTPVRDLTLVLQLDGSLDREVLRGGRWVADRATAGALGLMAPMEAIRVRGACAAPFQQVQLLITGRLLEEAADALRRCGSPASPPALHSFTFRDPSVAHAMGALLRAARAGLPNLYAEQAATWLATHLLTVHGAAGAGRATPGARGAEPRLRRAMDLIHERYALPLPLDVLAAEAGISKFHFATLFRALTGRAPHRYLEERRMAEARRLLAQTDLAIGVVGRDCGYPDAANFARAFRRHHAETPAAFRRRERACRV